MTLSISLPESSRRQVVGARSTGFPASWPRCRHTVVLRRFGGGIGSATAGEARSQTAPGVGAQVAPLNQLIGSSKERIDEIPARSGNYPGPVEIPHAAARANGGHQTGS